MPRGSLRSKSGLGALDLAIGALWIVIILMVATDIGIMMLANATVDRAARDACRAAAQQDTLDNAIKAARAALTSHQTDGYWLSQPELYSTEPPHFAYEDNDGNPLAENDPMVTVTVRCTARLPVPIDFLGQRLAFSGDDPTRLDFIRRYSFPIVRFKLAPEFM